MGIYICVEQLSDHPLILRLVLGCVRLEKLDAPLAQGNGYLYTLIAKRKLAGRGRKSDTTRYSPIGSFVYTLFSRS